MDGIDIASLNLVDLRRRVIALMPQQPAVFEGSVRENLDVEGTRTDEQLRGAIDICQMGSVFNIQPDGEEDVLEYRITELGFVRLSASPPSLALPTNPILSLLQMGILHANVDSFSQRQSIRRTDPTPRAIAGSPGQGQDCDSR
jgi:hypothetical protein